MFGKVNINLQRQQILQDRTRYERADRAGNVIVLAAMLPLVANARRSQRDELMSLLEWEMSLEEDIIKSAAVTMGTGLLPKERLHAAIGLFIGAHLSEAPTGDSETAVNRGCGFGLALALDDPTRIGEKPPVAQMRHITACPKVPLDDEWDKEAKGLAVSSACATFVAARAGLL
jgi:hypothetical protein